MGRVKQEITVRGRGCWTLFNTHFSREFVEFLPHASRGNKEKP